MIVVMNYGGSYPVRLDYNMYPQKPVYPDHTPKQFSKPIQNISIFFADVFENSLFPSRIKKAFFYGKLRLVRQYVKHRWNFFIMLRFNSLRRTSRENNY
jgi:hypothetical protein